MNRQIGLPLRRWSRSIQQFGTQTLRLKVVLWLSLIAVGSAEAQGIAAADLERQAAAIGEARQGDYVGALDALADLRARYPDAVELLYDEIVVLAWAERDADVGARVAGLASDAVPIFVQLAAAKSLRNLREFDRAVSWYSAALAGDPQNIDARIGLAYSLADSGDPAAARDTLAPLGEVPEHFVAATLASAYVDERAGQWLPALAAYDRVIEQVPEHAAALRGKALVLRALLLPSEALAIAAEHPGILSAAEIGRLRADEIALQVRYGTQVAYPVDQEHAMTDRALAALDAYLAAGVSDPSTETALRSDRIIALAERRASAEAVAEFEQLRAVGTPVSAPVLAAAGKAYLDLHEPEPALVVLLEATALAPASFDLKFALFFAYTDLNRYDDALGLARELAASLPLVSGNADSPSRQPNPDRVRAEILVGLALAYADRLDEAQAHLETWLERAPNNADLRHELASVYRSRGWLDRSSFEYQQVLAVEPDLLDARVGHAQTALGRREFEAAAADVSALNATSAAQPAVARLARAWDAHDSALLRIDANAHDSDGVTFGSRQYDLALTWYSAPLRYRYRAFASLRDAFAEFPEGDSRRRRVAGGLQYEYGRWFAAAELSADRDGGGELGARASASYRLDDYWLLSAELALESDAVPLRGHRVGLDSDLLRVAARFAPDETWSVEAGATLEDYSDGNAHEQLDAQGRVRLINRSSVIVEALGEAFIGNRRRNDVPYFSPLRDVAVIVGLESQWHAVRRYERRISHVLRGEIGTYDQSGFSRGSVWRLAYMMPVELSPTLSTWFGLWRSRMFYDGAHEYTTTASASLQVRF